ncbi:MAG: T9SS type A sorting domain-containing protein [Ignavibacteria bacterium]|nr:T9SS type A sorting domain-containing protein [Ignavibacteria bacterium]
MDIGYNGTPRTDYKNLYDVSARYDIMLTYIAIGEEGVILKSEDDGYSWTKLSGGVNSKFNSISSPTENTSYVVGTRGTILKTVDGGALPVELTSFNYSLNINNVTLYWLTSGEINNSGFEVERSNVNGEVSNSWESIGFVEGQGSTNQSHEYNFEDRKLSAGKYKYRLRQTDFSGNYEYYNLNSEVVIGTPEKYELSQNYPNPFNPVTHLEFGIPDLGFVTLKVYDITGREVKTLVKEIKPAGRYSLTFDGSNLSSGIYFYTLTAGEFKQTKRMMILK